MVPALQNNGDDNDIPLTHITYITDFLDISRGISVHSCVAFPFMQLPVLCKILSTPKLQHQLPMHSNSTLYILCIKKSNNLKTKVLKGPNGQ